MTTRMAVDFPAAGLLIHAHDGFWIISERNQESMSEASGSCVS